MFKFISKALTKKILSVSLCLLITMNIFMIVPELNSSAVIGTNIFKNLTGAYAKFVDSTYNTEVSGWHAATNLNASTGDRYVQPISNSTKLWIDLGAIYSITKLSLNWDPSNYATKYNIVISNDNTNWTILTTVERTAAGTANTNFPTMPDCRYMVIDVISVVGSSWALVNNSTGELNALYGFEATAPVNVSANKLVNLVDKDGKDIPSSEIINAGAKIVDGDDANYAETQSTKFGAIINLQGLAKISDISVTSYKDNSISKYDIKGSKDGCNWDTIASDIVILPSQKKLTNIGQKYIGRFIWIAPSAFNGSSLFTMGEVTVNGQMVSYDSNLALNKTVLAYEHQTTVQINTFIGELTKAVDGSASSYNPNANFAQATAATPNWDMVIDFNNVASISALKYTPEKDNYIEEFDLYTSFDGIAWTAFKTGLTYSNDVVGQDGSGKTEQYVFAYPAVGRYLKLSPAKVNIKGNVSHCVTEVEAIGYNPTGIIPSSYKMIYLENGGAAVTTSALYPVDKAFDGDNATYTQSSTFIPWDMLVTLPDNYEILGIYIRSNSTGKIHIPLDFTIEGSNNGFGFTPIKTVTGNTKTTYACTFSSNTVAKYIRLNVSKSSLATSSSGYNIAEFQVFGRQKAPEVKPATNISISSSDTLNLYEGDTSPIVISSIEPLDASTDIAYSSENTSVAKVSNSGVITAVGGGITTVHIISGMADKQIQVGVLGNVAIGKGATMSAEPGWGNIADYAIDGNMGSLCQANADTLWNLTIDLKDYFSISGISVDQSDACYATKYNFEASINGLTWFPVLSEQDFKVNEHKMYKFTAMNARFIRFVPVAKQTNGASIAIKEIGVFGEKFNAENQVVNTLSLDTKEVYLVPRKEYQLTGTVDPIETMISWTSSDENVAKVDGAGKITALKSGVAKITAKAGDKSDVCKVYVKRDVARNANVEMIGALPGWGNIVSFAVDGNKDTVAQSNRDTPWDLMVDIGSVQSINSIYYRPDGYNYAKDFSIKVSVDKENWITVTNAGITGDGSPKTFDFASVNARYVWLDVVSTYVKLPAGVTDSSSLDYGAAIYDFEVYADFVGVIAASMAKSSMDIPIGYSYPAKINFAPTNASIQTASWKSSDSSVATVDADGNIKGINSGEAVITATTFDKDIVLTMNIRVYESENVALYKKNVWMDADVGFGNDASNAVDGSYQTVAQSMLNIPWSLIVQLPIKTDIGSFRVTLNDFNFANHYKILIADNANGPWTLVYENNNASPKMLSIFLDNKVSANYVKFEAVSTLGPFGYAIHEFEINTAYGFDNSKIPKPNFLDSGPKNWDGELLEQNNTIVYPIIQTFLNRYNSARSKIEKVNTKELLLRLKNLLFENGELTAPIEEIIDNIGTDETSSAVEQNSSSSQATSSNDSTIKPDDKPKASSDLPLLPVILIILLIANGVFLVFSFVYPKLSVKKGMERL